MSTGCSKPGCLSRFKTVTFTLELAVRVVIASLASYRLARMVALETGPFALFSRFRGWVNIEQAVRSMGQRKHGLLRVLVVLYALEFTFQL
jgi:hypothetical protein